MSRSDAPRLLVNGREIQAHEVGLIYQSDPFPGGHSFEWSVPRFYIRATFWNDAHFATTEQPDDELARHWFFWLKWIHADWVRSHNQPQPAQHKLLFILNTIDALLIDEGGITVRGRCSPFVERPSH